MRTLTIRTQRPYNALIAPGLPRRWRGMKLEKGDLEQLP